MCHSLHVASPVSSGTRMSTKTFKASTEAATLVNVLHAAPTLLQSLCPAAMGAVSSTCTQLRCLVHEHVTKMTIIKQWGKRHDTQCAVTDLQALMKGRWPCLQYLKLRYRAAKVGLETGAFKQLTAASWSSLARLDLSQNPFGADAMSQLVLGKWPALRNLNLSYCLLDSAAIASLSKANWPLEALNLGGNSIDTEAMKQLVQGSWPKLAQLGLQRAYVDVGATEVLAKAQWPLRCLDLSYSGFRANAAMTQLAKGKWPQLEELKLDGNRLNAEGIVNLGQADWPHLASLNLASCHLHGANIAGLCQAHWPRLSTLDLTGNKLDESSMTHLLKNNWPALKKLRMGGNYFQSDAAVKVLLHNTFRKLEVLNCTSNFGWRHD